eukprot:3306088-Pleurochrysis_carterae.AAC.1
MARSCIGADLSNLARRASRASAELRGGHADCACRLRAKGVQIARRLHADCMQIIMQIALSGLGRVERRPSSGLAAH